MSTRRPTFKNDAKKSFYLYNCSVLKFVAPEMIGFVFHLKRRYLSLSLSLQMVPKKVACNVLFDSLKRENIVNAFRIVARGTVFCLVALPCSFSKKFHFAEIITIKTFNCLHPYLRTVARKLLIGFSRRRRRSFFV